MNHCLSLFCNSCIYLQYLHFVILHHKSQNPLLYITPKFVGSQKSISSHDYFNDCSKPEDCNARVNGMNMEKKVYAIIFHTKRWQLNPVANYIYNLWIYCIGITLFFLFLVILFGWGFCSVHSNTTLDAEFMYNYFKTHVSSISPMRERERFSFYYYYYYFVFVLRNRNFPFRRTNMDQFHELAIKLRFFNFAWTTMKDLKTISWFCLVIWFISLFS